MVTIFEPKFPGATESSIAVFERDYNLELPKDYRDFVLTHNGGSPSPPSACLPKGMKEPVLVDMLFGLDHQERDLDIRTWMRDLGSGLPPRCVVIGNVGGLLFLLFIDERRAGVFCWDRMGEFEEPGGEQQGQFYPIARTFAEFMDSLKPLE